MNLCVKNCHTFKFTKKYLCRLSQNAIKNKGVTKMIKRLVLGMISVLLLTLTVACNTDDDDELKEEDQIVAVETATIQQDDLTVEKKLHGRLSPEQMTPVLLENPGEIDEILIENGEQVEEDDIIAKLKTPGGIQNIRAPDDGEIIELEANEGDMLSGEDPLAFIIDLDQLTLDFTVTEKDRSLFNKDDKLDVLIDENTYELVIESVEKMPDDTGLYPISGTVKNKKDRLLPGMIATIHVPEKRVKKALIIPTEALIEDNDSTFIYVIKEHEAVRTDVTVIETQSDLTAVEGELNKEDTIVINGQLTLFDGAEVEVVSEENES